MRLSRKGPPASDSRLRAPAVNSDNLARKAGNPREIIVPTVRKCILLPQSLPFCPLGGTFLHVFLPRKYRAPDNPGGRISGNHTFAR